MVGATGGLAPAGSTTVRKLGPHDLTGLRALAAAGPDVPVAVISASEFAAWLDGGCCFVAEIDGQIVGCLLVQPISYFDDVPLTVWVDRVLVRPATPYRNVAAALLRAFGAWGRGARVRAALTRIETGDANARSALRQAGFVSHATGALVWRFADS